MPFHKGNQRQSVVEPRAITYLTGALTGQTAPTTLTVNLPRQFRQFSNIIVGVPGGLPAGVTLSASLLPPTGPAVQGNRPRLHIDLGGAGAIPAASADLLVTQL